MSAYQRPSSSPFDMHQQPNAQASLQLSLNALNAKIVQAQSLALINGISVDEVLSRMGGLNDMELGLLKLCAAREQEARLQANVLAQQQALERQQYQQQAARFAQPITSMQEHRNVNRSMVEQNLRVRTGKEFIPQEQQPQTWEDDFARMNLATAKPIDKRPAEPKAHHQVATWRTGGKQQATPPSPTSPVQSTKTEQKGGKSFNGVFGNKVALSGSPLGRSESRDSTGILEGKNTYNQSPTRGSRRTQVDCDSPTSDTSERNGRDRLRNNNMTSSSCSSMGSNDSAPPFVLITPPIQDGEYQESMYEKQATAGYFTSKKLGDEFRSRKGTVGVIGQGNGAIAGVVIRQPYGPPGGADELGNKNFASRLRRKAVNDLEVLGRRRAQSPMIEQPVGQTAIRV